MSHSDYIRATKLLAESPTFESLIMAAIHIGNHEQEAALVKAFPKIYKERLARLAVRGGIMPGEDGHLPAVGAEKK